MTIRKRKGADGYYVSAFTLDGTYYWLPFDGKKGLPFITDEKEAKEYEDKLKKELRAGMFVKHSPLRNFTKFYQEVFLKNSRDSKSLQAQDFDEYYGGILLGEFGKKRPRGYYAPDDRKPPAETEPHQDKIRALLLARDHSDDLRPYQPALQLGGRRAGLAG